MIAMDQLRVGSVVLGAQQNKYQNITRIRTMTDNHQLARWKLCDLGRGGSSFLLLKDVDNYQEVGIYHKPKDFTPGTRAKLLKTGSSWLFAEMPQRAPLATWPLSIELARQDGKYRMIAGIVYGSMLDTNSISHHDTQFSLLAEYIAKRNNRYRRLFILEAGAMLDNGEWPSDGGYMMVLQGDEVPEGSVEVRAR